MNKLKALYFRACKKWGPGGLTLSAWAWKKHLEGESFWRNRIDGLFMLFAGQDWHCFRQWEREAKG